MHQSIGTRRTRFFEQQVANGGCRPPSLFRLEGGPETLADDVEGSSVVPEDVAPAAGTRRGAARVTAECDGPRAADGDDTGLAGTGADERDQSIVAKQQMVGGE